MDTALAMEAVDILADHTLKNITVHKLNQGHVSLRRSCLLNSRIKGYPVRVGQRLALSFHLLLEFVLHGSFLPAAGSCREHGAVA